LIYKADSDLPERDQIMRTTDRDSLVPFQQSELPASTPWAGSQGNLPGPFQAGSMARVPVPHSSAVEIIHRGWRRIAIVAGCCVFLAILYCMFARPLYSGRASLLVSEAGHPLLVNGDATSIGAADPFLYTQTTVISSTPIIKAAVEKGNFNQMKTFLGVTDIVALVQNNLDVELGKKDAIITLQYDAYNSQEATIIVDSVLNAYLDYQTTQVQSTAGTVKDMLAKEYQKQMDALTAKQIALFKFKAANGTLSMTDSDKGNIVIQRLTQISSALTDADLAAITEKANWNAAQIMFKDPNQRREWLSSQYANNHSAFNDDSAHKDLTAWQLNLAALHREYADNHPAIQRAKMMIEQLQAQLAQSDQDLVDGYLATLKQNFQKSLEKKGTLQREFDDAQKAVADLNSTAVEEAKLDDDVKQGQHMIDSLDSRIKEMSVMQGSTAMNTTVVEPAAAPLSPNKPYRGRILFGSVAVGLLFGFGYAWIGEYTERCFHTPEEVQSTLGLPVFAVIPHMNRAAAAHGRLVQLDPMSPVAEAFRSLRTAINFAIPIEKTKTLLITSPTAGEGKSTVVSNLAIAMAQAGRKVIVLDADFRKPTQHKIFDIDESVGLSSVLAGTSTLENAIRRVNVDRVDVLPCGPLPANPSEILNSDMFRELLAQLTEKYDNVILDSPPVTAVTDGRILSAMCDGTMLVVRAGRCTQRVAENACDALMSVGGTMHGIVMNGVAHRALRNGYQYGYGYRNGEGRTNGDPERIRVRIHNPETGPATGLLH
jgi:succinoglycan biosynthesis transport protein ExoP